MHQAAGEGLLATGFTPEKIAEDIITGILMGEFS
jgi:hypothetical protein